jgi:threonine dehydrogenase-like Zn-dependent dehydrogenase
MRAACWYGSGDIRVETVPDPAIINPHDAIIRVTLTAICGSDLHIYNGFIPGMQTGDILGHEFMGEVVEIGNKVEKLKKGDRVVVPFTICCGKCHYCGTKKWSLCDNTNPNASLLNKLYGASGAGLFGYSHLYGGYAGGQAQYVRVPFADVGPIKVENDPPTNRCFSSPTSFPPAIWPLKTAISSPETSSLSGAAAPLASSPFAPPTCSARNGSLPLTMCLNAWKWRKIREKRM